MNKPLQPQGSDPLPGLLRDSREDRPLPPGFQRAVWRRIEKREATSASSWGLWFDRLAEGFLRPKFALAGLAAILLAGIIAGLADGLVQANQAARERYLTAVAPMRIR
jgi:hypothetical protein